MPEIRQFRYSRDNLAYLLIEGSEVLAIDGGAVKAILSFLSESGLTLTYTANTHGHPDHTMGTFELTQETGATYIDRRTLIDTPEFQLGGALVKMIPTPGHTMDSVCFLSEDYLISGDTLFNGTVGNCFSGDLEAFFKSIKTLTTLPGKTVVCGGHDYVEESMAFAQSIDPGNPDISAYLKAYRPDLVFSTLEQELRVNPYLRFNDPSMTEILKRKGYQTDTEYDRWSALMDIE